jgi:glycyl-tRNA synthetase
MGGVTLDPVSVELTYGLERILIALNNAAAIWDEPWGGSVRYGEIRRGEEFEHSKYYFELADVANVRKMYDLYAAEAERSLEAGLVLPAHDYVLKCSHAFNIMDTRGAISVAERQAFFKRMRALARGVAEAYVQQRQELEYPLLQEAKPRAASQAALPAAVSGPAEFVLELGVEEMPADDITRGAEALRQAFEKDVLDGLGLAHDEVKVFGTPRRLVVHVANLAAQQADSQIELRGPPESAAFDSAGAPTPALLGWARKNQIDLAISDMTRERLVRELPGGRYVAWTKGNAGSPTASMLASLLPGVLGKIKFEKSMRWNESGVSFSRPIRWIVAMYAESVIPFEFAGVTAGGTTRGLRPNSSPEAEIRSASQYFDEMKRLGVVLDAEERKRSVREQVVTAAERVGGTAVLAEGLLTEVANLVEKPTAVLGNFQADFLRLPREVLISVMQKHQRYFPIEKEGKLLPNFVAIRNGDDQHLDLVQQGNEHVLEARFADADFFVSEDVRRPLEDYVKELSGLTFHARLGSMLDKTERIQKLVSELIPMLGLDKDGVRDARRAARLCKADLVTNMVTEMTSLQGVMGAEYALRSGETESVARAIWEHYQPSPTTRAGTAVALADRLDSLVGLFAVDLAPTGAKDPFGLRRAALGIVQPLLDQKQGFDLKVGIDKTARLQPVKVDAKRRAEVLDFIRGRLAVVLKDSGFRYDIVEAVLAEQASNPAGARRSVQQLQTRSGGDDWRTILPAFARCVRITRGQKKQFAVEAKALIAKEEKELWAALRKGEATLRSASQTDVDTLLAAFVPMIPSVNRFFDKILVMSKKKAERENRLGLLQRIAGLASGIADLSRLEGF